MREATLLPNAIDLQSQIGLQLLLIRSSWRLEKRRAMARTGIADVYEGEECFHEPQKKGAPRVSRKPFKVEGASTLHSGPRFYLK